MPLIEGPKHRRAEFEGTSHVQRVQGATTQLRHMSPGKLNRPIESRFRQDRFKPEARPSISVKVVVSPVSFGSRDSALKDLLRNGMSTLHPVKWRQPNAGILLHLATRARRMNVGDIQRNQKT